MSETFKLENKLSNLNNFKEEIIDGKIYYMSPSANPIHSRIIGNIFYTFKNYLKGKRCQVYADNLDVYLGEEKNTIVIPDISVICDTTKFTSNGYHGVPTLVVEIISPSSAARDRNTKFKLYEKYGVMEYWIVDPLNQIIEQFILKDNKYEIEGTFFQLEEEVLERYSEEERNNIIKNFKTSIFSDLVINLCDVFE